jgi:tRNA (cytidine56-2'-O)-methyltransferase
VDEMLAILRLGHRIGRDKRVTTHVALTARAFGADKMFLSSKDAGLVRSVRSVVVRFGGDFEIEDGVDWRKLVRAWQGTVVHLTMYGLPIGEAVPNIPKGDVLVVVGAEKVPPEIYDLAHFNVAVGNQPHSEVAAVAVFLDRLLGGEGVRRVIKGRLTIIPCERGKTVVDSGEYPSTGR